MSYYKSAIWILFFLLFCSFIAGNPLHVQAATAKVNVDVANIRSAPNTKSSVSGQIIKDTSIKVLKREEGWMQIQYGKVNGWISESLVTLQVFPLTVTADLANLRKGPGTNFAQTGQVKKGMVLIGLEKSGDWYQVQGANGDFVYINADLVATKGSVSNTATQPPPVTTPSRSESVTAPQVYLDKNLMKFEVEPIIRDGRTLVPLRAIFEAMGATVEWESNTSTVTARNESIMVQLRIGDNFALVNGVRTEIDVPAQLLGGRTLAPLRFVGETFGGKVDWNSANRVINIISKDAGQVDEHSTSDSNVVNEPRADLDEVKVAFTTEVSGLKIAITSDKMKDMQLQETNNTLNYIFSKSYISTAVSINQQAGAGQININGNNEGEQVKLGISIPSGLNFQRSTENNGKTEVVLIPNAVVGVERQPFGSNGERIIVKTLAPTTYSNNMSGDDMKVTINATKIGLGQSNYTFGGSKFLKQVELDESSTSMLGVRISTNEKAKFTVGQSDDKKEVHILFIPSREAVPNNGIVVLDAGHGGGDTGARGTNTNEKDINLDITLKAGKILEKNGIKVHYTRTTDIKVELEDIATYANMMNAELFVSVHNNSATNKNANGTETYFYAPIDNSALYMQKDDRERIASLLMAELSKLNREYRGVKQKNLSVLRNANMPSALVEIAFISNAEEEALLRQENFRQRAAQLIADAIISYMKGSSASQRPINMNEVMP